MKLTVPASIALLAAVGALFSAGAAAQVTVGQLASADNTELCSFIQPYDELVATVGAGTSYEVPGGGGLITSWSTASFIAAAKQKLALKVFRPAGPNTYTPIAEDERSLQPQSLNTFEVAIPAQAGDIVGLHIPSSAESPSNNCAFEGAADNNWAFHTGSAPIGVPATFETYGSADLLNVSATVLPPPAISGLSPGRGSIKGGTAVKIAGQNFGRVTAVSFGSRPAARYTVGDEGQISAVSPAATSLAAVPITVTTAAGAGVSPTSFAYQGCRVPKLRGKKLKASKKRVRKAGCKTGKVRKRKGARAATGKVVKQSPKPGSILPPGGKVKVTLAPAAG